MARSIMVGNMMYQHVSWSGDALTVNVPGHKGDKEGAKDYARHVYANPLEPAICPILSLAVMIFSSSFRSGDKRQQGSPSYALAMVEGPNPVQVFLRAGWSLGNVPDRYLFAGKGGDQLVGRVVAGLPMTDDRFGTLPPHLPQSVLEEITEEMLYAAGLFAKFNGKVLVGRVECPETGMVATGVPSHIMLAKSVRDLSKRIDALECGHKRRHEEILTAFTDLKETLPKMLRTDLLENFEVNGALPLTQDDLSRQLDNIAARLEESIEKRLSAVRTITAPEAAPSAGTPIATFTHWTWGGRVMQMVPEGFRMPECSVKDLWDLWHFGHVQNRI
eukprot:gene35606-43904_t